MRRSAAVGLADCWPRGGRICSSTTNANANPTASWLITAWPRFASHDALRVRRRRLDQRRRPAVRRHVHGRVPPARATGAAASTSGNGTVSGCSSFPRVGSGCGMESLRAVMTLPVVCLKRPEAATGAGCVLTICFYALPRCARQAASVATAAVLHVPVAEFDDSQLRHRCRGTRCWATTTTATARRPAPRRRSARRRRRARRASPAPCTRCATVKRQQLCDRCSLHRAISGLRECFVRTQARC